MILVVVSLPGRYIIVLGNGIVVDDGMRAAAAVLVGKTRSRDERTRIGRYGTWRRTGISACRTDSQAPSRLDGVASCDFKQELEFLNFPGVDW